MIGSISATVASRAGGLGAQLPGRVRLVGLHLDHATLRAGHVPGEADARLAEAGPAHVALLVVGPDGHCSPPPTLLALRSFSRVMTVSAWARVRLAELSRSGRPVHSAIFLSRKSRCLSPSAPTPRHSACMCACWSLPTLSSGSASPGSGGRAPRGR